jgi:hypothetical protein
MKINMSILQIGAEGIVPRQCMYSLLVVRGLIIIQKRSTPSSYSGRPGFESLTGDCLS